ncbi:MAG: molybdopterin-binding protein [Leptolyngbyaceae cyanobacterium bins.349]|nr:molybdopterin-binding protein [Leptolyngbyaceae cyanobacterium bins.349]
MPRKDQGWITFQTSEEERQLLEEVCQISQRTKTEVLRELLRGLQYATPALEQNSEAAKPGEGAKRSRSTSSTSAQQPSSWRMGSEPIPPKPLKVSSRNVLEGRVTELIKGPVSTEITLEIVHRVALTSTITTTSAEALELEVGKSAYAVIKSSDVVIAME